ncbi:MAG: hypothetical protein WBA91_14075 [Paracoccaceae bacterium]
MEKQKTLALVLFVIVLAAATIWLAFQLAGEIMPVWMAALGPIFLALTVWTHVKSRGK